MKINKKNRASYDHYLAGKGIKNHCTPRGRVVDLSKERRCLSHLCPTCNADKFDKAIKEFEDYEEWMKSKELLGVEVGSKIRFIKHMKPKEPSPHFTIGKEYEVIKIENRHKELGRNPIKNRDKLVIRRNDGKLHRVPALNNFLMWEK